ncbi:MAG: hypothetical protein ABTD50_16330 [Polyangiaceae bacterium]|jgi:hypothetical protein
MEAPDRLGLLRPLGVGGVTFAVREMFDGRPVSEVLVAEWIVHASMSDGERSDGLRRARALMFLGHPKLASIRDIVMRGADGVAICGFVDGEWLEMWQAAPVRPTLGMHLRVQLDVLDALGALHGLRDQHGELLHAAHGRLAPDAVLVGSDGVGRLTRSCAGRRLRGSVPTTAPELRDPDAVATPAADVYAVGAMLRDAMDRAGPGEHWNPSLDAVVARACDEEPDRRWAAASAMAMALRTASGPLPTSVHVSAFMRDAFDGRMRARRAALESQVARPFTLAEHASAHAFLATQSRPTPAQLGPVADEPKVQIAASLLDPPTMPRLAPAAPGDNPVEPEISESDILTEDLYRRRLPTIRILNAHASRWRTWDSGGIATAIAILVAFAIGSFLGGRACFVSSHPAASARPTASVPQYSR